MKCKIIILTVLLMPGMAWAQASPEAQGSLQEPLRLQGSTTSPLHPERSRKGRGAGGEGVTPTTLTVLLANCPKSMSATEWLRMMEVPANRSLFPLRITQGMLDTLPVKELDLRFQYVFAPNTPQLHEIRQH